MITANDALIDGVKNFIKNGGDVNSASPADCFDHISPELHSYVTSLERSTSQQQSGEAARCVRYLWAMDRETLPTEENKRMHKHDGWVTEKSDNAVLITMHDARGDDKDASFTHLDKLHHLIDGQLDSDNAAFIIQSSNQTKTDATIDKIIPIMDYDLVILPRSYTSDTVKINGMDHLVPCSAWMKKYDKHNHIIVDGSLVATVEQVRTGHRRIYMMVGGPFDLRGELNVYDEQMAAAYASIIGSIITGEQLVAEDVEFGSEDIDTYRTAASLLDIIKSTAKDNKGIEEKLANSLINAKDNIEAAMNTISNMQKRINEESDKLSKIRQGDMDHLIENTIGIISEMNRIGNDQPVKSCTLKRTEDGETYFDIYLHPIVLDVEEEKDRREDGEPHIILNDLHLHLKLITGGDISRVIKWIYHDGNGYTNDERRPHPHIESESRACYGDAGPEIATAIGNGAWHDMMQWVYAWCFGYRVGDTVITFCENFPTAPKGSVPGWVIPE